MAQHNVQDLHIGALHAHAAHAAHSGNGVLHAVHGQALAGLEHPLLQAHLQTGKGALQRGGDLGGAGGLRSVAHHAADGADAVANLEVVEHRLGFLVLLALRTDQQEVEHDEDQDHRHKLHGIVDDGRAGAHGLGRGGRVGRRGGGGGVSQQVHKGILHGERHILSFIG